MVGHTSGVSSLAGARMHEVLVGTGAGWGPPPLLARRLGKLDILVIQSGRPTARQAPEPFVPKGQAKAGRCLSLGMTRARVGTRLRRAFGNTLNLPHNLKPFSTDRKLRPDGQRQLGILEHGAGGQPNLLLAAVALEQLAGLERAEAAMAAGRTGEALAPAPLEQRRATGLLGPEPLPERGLAQPLERTPQ